jgi:hypothetical protein
MIEAPVAEHREVTEVVFTAADLISGSSESKRAKVSETLLNILEGRVRNSNTRKAYRAARRSFFAFCSEYKLELDRVKPYHFGLWLKRHTGSAPPSGNTWPPFGFSSITCLRKVWSTLIRPPGPRRHAWKEKAHIQQSLNKMRSRRSWMQSRSTPLSTNETKRCSAL